MLGRRASTQSNSSATYGHGERLQQATKEAPTWAREGWGAGGEGQAMASALQASR